MTRGDRLGIDIGGTQTKWVVLDRAGLISGRGTFATPRTGPPDVVAAILALVARQTASGGPVAGVGIAVPGQFDLAERRMTIVPNLPGAWRGFPFWEWVEQGVEAPVALLNDARAFAVAEAGLGAARGLAEALFVTVGTGIGGAVLLDGKVLRGRSDAVGEIGHITVDPDGPACGCGARGCAEAYAGGANMVARAARAAGADATSWRAPGDVWVAAGRGHPVASTVTSEATRAVGLATASAAALLGITTAIVGGGLAAEHPEYEEGVRTALAARSGLLGPTRVVRAAMGTDGGAIGAALAATAAAGEGAGVAGEAIG